MSEQLEPRYIYLIDSCIPWQECDLSCAEPPCSPSSNVDVRFRNGKTFHRSRAGNWAWGSAGQYTVTHWRYADLATSEIERKAAHFDDLLHALTSLYAVAKVDSDEDYGAVTNAAAAIERATK